MIQTMLEADWLLFYKLFYADDLLTVRQSEVDILDGELTTLQHAITDKLDTLQTSHNEHVQASINWTDSANQKINTFRVGSMLELFVHNWTFVVNSYLIYRSAS